MRVKNVLTFQISFLGLASEDSIVLIDSFRYIPPQLSKETCTIYGEDQLETTTSIPITTPAPTGEACVTYNFESEFEDYFDTDNQLCNGYSAWHLGNYYSLSIENIYPESSTFIAPNVSSSCISSFVFEMKPQGYVEVNVFMKALSELDFVVILAQKRVKGSQDTVAGFQLYYAANEDFVEGWNVLRVNVVDFHPFNGYVSINEMLYFKLNWHQFIHNNGDSNNNFLIKIKNKNIYLVLQSVWKLWYFL